jgi:serine/threonine protein kinase/Tol biopolymer transport system component
MVATRTPMATTPTKLGPYEILSPLGSGGMGEVYRARDSRLNREVAVKILRGDVADDPSRRARFEREAQTVAGLNHPNIVALFEVGNEDGVEYTVSELVDGEPLRSLIQPGGVREPMPLRRVVDLSAQLADGLAAAHAAGIVHRDLKPENIMVTRDGRVKILDFGLARQMAPPTPGSGAPALETILQTQISSENLTSPGMVLGTAAYMSPEQARGQDTDYRSDQFSFGLIVYEMVTGQAAFSRPSAVETMAAIVRDEAPPLESKVPAPLRWVIERCLEKDPIQRFDSTRDLYQQLRILRDHFSEAFSSGVALSGELPATTAAADQAAAKPSAPLWLLAALLILGAAIATPLIWFLKPSGIDLAKYKYTPFAMNTANYGYAVWSPDGKSVAYSAKSGDNYPLFLRNLDSPTAVQLTHDHGVAQPIGWSADHSHILYLWGDEAPIPIRLYAVSSVGGDPQTVMEFNPPQNLWATLSPDGNTAAFFMAGPDHKWSVFISSPVGSPPKPYSPAPFAGGAIFHVPKIKFAPDGKKILLLRAGDNGKDETWILPWPAGSAQPHLVLQNLPIAASTPGISWMPDSRHVLITTVLSPGDPGHIWLADTESKTLTMLTNGTAFDTSPTASPDGKTILYSQYDSDLNIVSMSIPDATTKDLIDTARNESMAAWAANTPKLAYVTDRNGPPEIWLHSADGADRPLVTLDQFPAGSVKAFMNPALSPDGERVIYTALESSGKSVLWMSSVSGGAPITVTNNAEMPMSGDWSPDGSRFVFYESGSDRKLAIVSTSGNAPSTTLVDLGTGYYGMLPTWLPTGDWIAYADASGWHLISPDGKQHKSLGDIGALNLAFTKDGKTAYGLHTDGITWSLFSLNVDSGKVTELKQLSDDAAPMSRYNPGTRFSMAPDGKSFAYSTGRSQSSLWLLQGWQQ